MLEDTLKNEKIFKLICGAGLQDIKEVEKLIFIYSLAGARMFDVAADNNVIDAAKRALLRSGREGYLCVSVGLGNDKHILKAQIKENCARCGKCEEICPERAIKYFKVKTKNCTGCGRCSAVCRKNAIDMMPCVQDLSEILPSIIQKGIDCIELHAAGASRKEVFSAWDKISLLYDGILSICLNRAQCGDEELIFRIKKLIEKRKPYSTIVQADGCPISGGCDDFETTLQAVSTAQIIQRAQLPVYLMLSGGTNSKTAELAAMCNVKFNGIAIGSYSRKIVRPYIEQDDFFENKEAVKKAVDEAKELVVSINDPFSNF